MLFKDPPKPAWLKIRPPQANGDFDKIKLKLKELKLVTVCQEAHCPNIAECWGGSEKHGGTATFMIMGDTCTRGCRFCNVKTAIKGKPLDPDEPEKLAEAIKNFGLDYVVITSVDRDDLPDQGIVHFTKCVQAIKKQHPKIIVELLIPDFRGNLELIEKIAHCGAEVIGHNLETVARLQKPVRDPRANYAQSLSVLENLKKFNPPLYTKSALMAGIGETKTEVVQAMRDLLKINVSILTIGQYLRPSPFHLAVHEYIPPDQFNWYKETGEKLGFMYVAAGPFVRSSYRAGELFIKNRLKKLPIRLPNSTV